jgi:hypothetical protein
MRLAEIQSPRRSATEYSFNVSSASPTPWTRGRRGSESVALWREQYDRMRRWQGRLWLGVEHIVGRSDEAAVDAFYAFAQTCAHLVDWLENDRSQHIRRPQGRGACRSFSGVSLLRRHLHRLEAVAAASGGGQRPSLAHYVTEMGPMDGATAAGGRSCCLPSGPFRVESVHFCDPA